MWFYVVLEGGGSPCMQKGGASYIVVKSFGLHFDTSCKRRERSCRKVIISSTDHSQKLLNPKSDKNHQGVLIPVTRPENVLRPGIFSNKVISVAYYYVLVELTRNPLKFIYRVTKTCSNIENSVKHSQAWSKLYYY